MPITINGQGALVYTPIEDFDRFQITGVMRDDSFAICDEKDQLKQLKFNVTNQSPGKSITFLAGGNSANISLTLPDVSGTLALSSAVAANSFVTWQTITGTYPVADSPNDTMTLTSDGTISIDGDSASDTISFSLNPAGIDSTVWKIGGNSFSGSSDRYLGSDTSDSVIFKVNSVNVMSLDQLTGTVLVYAASNPPTFKDFPINIMRGVSLEGDGTALPQIRYEYSAGGSVNPPTQGVVSYYSEDHGALLYAWKIPAGHSAAIDFQSLTSDSAVRFPDGASGSDTFVVTNLSQTVTNKTLTGSTITTTDFSTGTIELGPSNVIGSFPGSTASAVTLDSSGIFSPQARLPIDLGGTNATAADYTNTGIFYWSSILGKFQANIQLKFNNLTLTVAPNGLTASDATSAIDISQNWNTTGTPTFIKGNVSTGTANAASLLFDLQVASASKFKIRKDGLTTIDSAAAYAFSGRSQISSTADGYLLLQNAAATDFTGLRFGGTSASFPMWKRNSTGFDARLADDSGYAPLTAASLGIGMAPIATWGAVQILSSGLNSLTMTDTISNATGKQGVFTGAPFTNANNAWTGFGITDNGSIRRLWWGGGGWGRPDATSHQFYTAPTYTQSNNTGVLRFEIFPDGHSVFKTAPVATANYGNVSIGSGAFDGSTSGFFAGSSSGTSIAINEASGYGGDLINAQVAGSLKFRVKANGDTQAGNDIYVVNGRFFGSGSNSSGTLGGFFKSPSDGVLTMYNGGVSDFNRLQFGGTTSSFPSLKRSSADIQFRLADDSGFAAEQSLYVRYGSGSPEGVVTAPVGAIYSRTDGGAATSLYVKESGSGNTGWVAK